jgi:hypothetical protein
LREEGKEKKEWEWEKAYRLGERRGKGGSRGVMQVDKANGGVKRMGNLEGNRTGYWREFKMVNVE